jgi:glycerophosphoryl diester phosphodiesterase
MIPLPEAFLGAPLAHRAFHDRSAGRPENSRAAFAAAAAAGYGIECDVQLSADGRAMVFHDEHLQRLTGDSGPLNARTAAELGGIALRDGGGEGIPTLAEMLALLDGRVPLLVEIKDQTGDMGPGVGALEQAVADDLRGYGGAVAVMSFNPHSVAAFGRACPGVARGLTTSAYRADDWPELSAEMRARLRDIPDYETVGASFLSHEANDLSRPRVAALKRAGARVLCWTIRSAEAEAAARRVADNVTFEGYRAAVPQP